jgi:Ras GTPase-activating-like protein IQGAP2/3
LCLNELGPATAQLPRSENRTVNLHLFSKWDQANIDDATSSAAADPLTRGEFLYYDTKALFVQILRLLPLLSSRRPLDVEWIIETASTSKDPLLVRKGLKVGDMFQELVEMNQITSMDGYALLTEEIDSELAHLGNLTEKVFKELESLSVVFKTIQDHNEYLRSQLETYKSYLQNVRVQSGPTPQKKAQKVTTPLKFTHQKLEYDGVICESNVPENRLTCLM